MDLNDLLDRSAPPVAPRSPALTGALDDLVVAAETAARSTGRRHRASLVSALTVAVLGVGTAGAMATGVVATPGWVPWTAGSGDTCELRFDAVPNLGAGVESPSRTYTADEEQQAVAEANRFLDGFDYRTIDADEAMEKWPPAVDDGGSDPEAVRRLAPIKDTLEELEAVRREVEDRLDKHLDDKGLPSEAVAVEDEAGCSRNDAR